MSIHIKICMKISIPIQLCNKKVLELIASDLIVSYLAQSSILNFHDL